MQVLYKNISRTRSQNQRLTLGFLYINNEHVRTNIENTIPHTITPRKMIHLVMNVTKYVHASYTENYKMLMNRIKEYLNTWKDILRSWM